MKLRIGTRASALAMWQARHVERLLLEHWPTLETELVPMTTTGDRILDRPLADIGGKGLFVKELEHGMFDGIVDIAVHSLKDMPTEQPEGLVLDVVVPRAAAGDVLCGTEHAYTLATLPQGARIGTGSQRRRAQLERARPDLEIVPLRGNILTRLEKRFSESLDAIVLAEAGLQRLDIWEDSFQRMDKQLMVPAPGQGAVVIERRVNDARVQELLAPLHCPKTAYAVVAERACLRGIGGDCHTPFAAYARFEDGAFVLHARMFHDERFAETTQTLPLSFDKMTLADAQQCGAHAAEALVQALALQVNA